MSRLANISDSISVYPTTFDSENSTYASVNTSYPIDNGYTNSSSTTRAQFNINTGSNAETYVYYNFDTSQIPIGATITSISCSVKTYISTTISSIVSIRQVQLCAGTTPKGSPSTVSISTTAVTLETGTWTDEEARNAKIRIYVKRDTSLTTTNYYVRFYGATLNISYSLDYTEYEISSTINTDLVNSINPAGTTYVREGTDYVLSIYADNLGQLENLEVDDNGNNVTSELVLYNIDGEPSSFIYTLANVSNDHLIELVDDIVFYVKSNDGFVGITAIYKKINGYWEKQTDYKYIFNMNNVYIRY